MIVTQLLTVVIFALLIFGASFIWLREKHMGGRGKQARIGALVYGLIFGGYMVLIMLPLLPVRMRMSAGDMRPGDEILQIKMLAAFALFIIIIRSDVTGRLPFLGTYIRAYRAALLRKTITGAEKRLDKMATLEGQGNEI